MDSSIERNDLGKSSNLSKFGLRIELGCVKMTSVEHLHAEANIKYLRPKISNSNDKYNQRILLSKHSTPSSRRWPQ